MMRKKERKIKRSFRIHRCLSALGMILVLGLSACQKSPESSIVVNKDMDNLIDEAQNGENGIVNVDEVAEAYDSYQVSLSNESLGVTITGEAKVDIPKTDQMSVLRVKQSPITQELLDTVRQELVQGETLYDGKLLDVLTRDEIEWAIQMERERLGKGLSEEEEQWIQEDIDQYQILYETASEEREYEKYPSDGKLHSVKELYQADPENDFCSWEYSLNPSGEVYYSVSNGKNGQYTSLWACNNPERGNCLRYRTGRSGYFTYIKDAIYAAADLEALERGIEQDWMADEFYKTEEEAIEQANNLFDGSSMHPEYEIIKDADATLSRGEAVQMADEFLDKVGLEGFEYSNGGLYYEVQYFSESGAAGYQRIYILSYMRSIDGGLVTYDATMKHVEGGYVDGGYVKKDWPLESIEFHINDDGIVGFDYNAPLEVIETVVDGAGMKSFEEVRSTFETMAAIQNADPNLEYYQKNGGEPTPVTIEVDRVVLGYARISEADSFDTGLLVPVWDFRGTVTLNTDYNSWSNYCSILTINAIDGSIIDRSLGY